MKDKRELLEPAARADGMPSSSDERHLRILLALRTAMPNTYFDDGEAHGQQHGISIDFMRDPVADFDAKLRALSFARLECSEPAPLSQELKTILVESIRDSAELVHGGVVGEAVDVPLPEPVDELAMEDGFNVLGSEAVFTSSQMLAHREAYAQAKVAAERRKCLAAVSAYYDEIKQAAGPHPTSYEEGRLCALDIVEQRIEAVLKANGIGG
jgi:hypothetical protein